MATQYNFLKPIDQKVRDQGYDFVSQDEYLQDGFKSTDGISYEGDGSPVSYANSMGGIMSQAPIPGPLKYTPPEGDGGGGDDDDDDDDDDNNPKGPSMSPMDALKNAGMFMMNPLGYLATKAFGAYRSRQKAKSDLAADQAYKAQREKDFKEMAANTKNSDGTTAAYNYAGRVSSGGRHDSTMSNEEAQANQDAGRGYKADGGRVGYFFGGRVNYKAGGRTDAGANRSTASHSTRGQINEAGQQVNNNSGNDGGGTKPTFYDKNNNIITTDFISKNPNLTVDYTDPRNYASVYGKIGFNNILDNDDITAEGNVTGKLGSIGYNTNFTDQGITGTNLTAGNFNANINPDMQVQNIGYNNNINGINYGVNTDFDNTMFTAGVNFKNGGLASIL